MRCENAVTFKDKRAKNEAKSRFRPKNPPDHFTPFDIETIFVPLGLAPGLAHLSDGVSKAGKKSIFFERAHFLKHVFLPLLCLGPWPRRGVPGRGILRMMKNTLFWFSLEGLGHPAAAWPNWPKQLAFLGSAMDICCRYDSLA